MNCHVIFVPHIPKLHGIQHSLSSCALLKHTFHHMNDVLMEQHVTASSQKWCLHWCSCELIATDMGQTLHYSFIYAERCHKHFSGVGLCGDIREHSYAANL